jgi:hypothetical protein
VATTSSRNNDVDPKETIASQVIGFLFRNAIVARVRAERRLLRILLEALLLASVVAILGWTYAGLPLSLCFSAVLVLFAEAFLQVHFADAYSLYHGWTTVRRQAYLTFGVFVLSRLALGEILGVPSPVAVYADIEARAGWIEAFRNNTAPSSALFEVLLDIPLMVASIALVVRRSRRALVFFTVQAVVFLFLAAMPITRSAFHACIQTNGVIVCTWKLLFSGFGS